MNNLHDYPPDWDKPDIVESPEFQGLLSKNVEALFERRSVDKNFMVILGEKQPDNLGCDVLTAMVLHLKECEEPQGHLKELKNEMMDVAIKHVLVSTKQDYDELQRHD